MTDLQAICQSAELAHRFMLSENEREASRGLAAKFCDIDADGSVSTVGSLLTLIPQGIR